MNNLDNIHPSLQIAICNWLEEKLPAFEKRLNKGILMPSGYLMTVDEVACHMASAAMSVFKMAYGSANKPKRNRRSSQKHP